MSLNRLREDGRQSELMPRETYVSRSKWKSKGFRLFGHMKIGEHMPVTGYRVSDQVFPRSLGEPTLPDRGAHTERSELPLRALQDPRIYHCRVLESSIH